VHPIVIINRERESMEEFKIGDIVEVDGETVYHMHEDTLRGTIEKISPGLFDIPLYLVQFRDFTFWLYAHHLTEVN